MPVLMAEDIQPITRLIAICVQFVKHFGVWTAAANVWVATASDASDI